MIEPNMPALPVLTLAGKVPAQPKPCRWDGGLVRIDARRYRASGERPGGEGPGEGGT